MTDHELPPEGARVTSRGYEGVVEHDGSKTTFLLVEDNGEDHLIYVTDSSWQIVDSEKKLRLGTQGEELLVGRYQELYWHRKALEVVEREPGDNVEATIDRIDEDLSKIVGLLGYTPSSS